MARIVLVVQPTPHGLGLTWFDGPAAFPSYELPGKGIADAAEGARRALGAVVECHFSEEVGDVAAAGGALATAGYALYQALFKPTAEQQGQVNEIRKWLDGLRVAGAVESLEVVAEGVIPIPWNLVYDRRPDAAAFRTGGTDPARWEPFWGLRYDLSGGPRVSPLRRFPVLENPRVVVVTDPSVIDNLPTESRELATLCRDNGWAHARSRTELVEALAGGRPDILYWLGHTQTEPFGLVLGDDVITPDDLRTLMEGDPFADAGEVFGGVAFLNACGTAQKNAAGSFLEALHPLGLSGYVATEQVTVDTFAAPLGREFLNAFAVRGEPLGKVMRTLRGQVPLGLLYGSYCPPMIQVRREGQGTPSTAVAGPVVVTGAVAGKKLGRAPGAAAAAGYPLPETPYRSLRAYGVDDRALFAGREDDAIRFAQVLDDPGTRVLLLHGESGVGKTSFLRAGVIPYLENECVGYRFARDRSKGGDTILLVRATNDPVSQIAAALTAYCSQSLTHRTPLGEDATADLPAVLRASLGGREGHEALRDALRADPALLGRLLADLSRVLPFTPVLIIDQSEEVFTLARTPADEENRGRALEMLRRAATGPAGFKIVVSLRTEYLGRFTDRLRKGSRDAGGVREYLLTDFGLDDLIEVIRRPTSATAIEYASEVPFEKYRFRYADGVAEEIARRARAYTINQQDSVLPLVQVICTQLFDLTRTRPDAVITQADLEAIGGVEGGMRAHAEGLVRRLFPLRADQQAFKKLLADPETQLFIRQSDGTLTTALLPADFLKNHWSGRMPFEEVLKIAGSGDWRLVRVNSLRIGSDDKEQPYVSLGHDSLARVAADWYEQQKRRKQLRKYAVALVVMAVSVGALSALTWWALDKSAQAERAAKAAEDSAAVAEVARRGAYMARATAEDERTKATKSAEEANIARTKAEKAELDTLASFKASTDEAIEQLIGSRPVLGRIEERYLKNTQERWEEFAKNQGNDDRGQAIRAEGHQRVGGIWGRLGKNDKAMDQYKLARAILEPLAKSSSARPEYKHALGECYNSLAVLLARSDQRVEALKLHGLAQTLQEELLKKFPREPDYRVEYAKTHHNMGILLGRDGKRDEALAAYQTAFKYRKDLTEEFNNVPEYQNDLARTHLTLGAFLAASSDPRERNRARTTYKDGLDIQKKLVEKFPDSARYQSTLADTHHNFGSLLVVLEERKDARDEYDEALKIQKKLVEDFPVVRSYRSTLARTHNSIGVMFHNIGRELPVDKMMLEQAREKYKAAIAIQDKLVAESDKEIEYRQELAQTRHNLGRTYSDLGELKDACEQYKEAVRVQRGLADEFKLPALKIELGMIYFNYGHAVRADKRPAESLELFALAVETLQPLHNEGKLDEPGRRVLSASKVEVERLKQPDKK